MQTRLLASVAGGLLGAVFCPMINAHLELSPTYAFIVCPLAGVAVGYVVSTLVDVFSGSHSDVPPALRK